MHHTIASEVPFPTVGLADFLLGLPTEHAIWPDSHDQCCV